VATALSKPHIDYHLNPEFPDTLDLLSERDVRRYRMQRRLIGPVYQTSNLIQYEPAIDEVLARAIAKLKSLKGAQVELNEWMHIIAVECLSAIVLSWSPGMLKSGTDNGSGTHAYHGWRRKSVFGLFPLLAKLEYLNKSIGRLFSTIWGVNFQPPKDFRPFFPVCIFILPSFRSLLMLVRTLIRESHGVSMQLHVPNTIKMTVKIF
jgi:hypothetical protein